MSSNQKQQEKDFNFHIARSIFNAQVVRAMFSYNKQKTLVEKFDRRQSNPSKTLSPGINYQVTRRSSVSSISKPVGSNRYFTSSIIYLQFVAYFVHRLFVPSKK